MDGVEDLKIMPLLLCVIAVILILLPVRKENVPEH